MTIEKNSHMEVIWGIPMLDEGFTSIPNILIRNYRKLSIEHGEMGFILNLLSYKHDTRDPYPSRTALANNLGCNVRQIDKWIKSLKGKGLLRTGRRRNIHNKTWDNTVYSLKPLIDELLKRTGHDQIPDVQNEYEIDWDDKEPTVPEVRMGTVPEVRMGTVPQVQTKKKRFKKEEEEEDIIYSEPNFINIFEIFEYQNNGELRLTPIQEQFITNLKKYSITPEMGSKILKNIDNLNSYNIEALNNTFKLMMNRVKGSQSIANPAKWFPETLFNQDFLVNQKEQEEREIAETNRKYGITPVNRKNPAKLADPAGFHR